MPERKKVRPLCLGMAAALTLAAGCAHYEPQPLAPAQTILRLEGRRLDDAGLKHFLEQNLGHPLPAWPLAEWDLNSLTLAAFYFHPDLAVARAQWQVATAGERTAAARLNPSVSTSPSYDSGIPGNFSPWIVPVTFDIPLETAGKRGKRMAEAEKMAESARWAFVSAAWQVRGNVRTALLDFKQTERRAALLQDQAADEAEIVSRTQQRLTAGESSRSELTTAQLALNRAQLDLADAQSKYAEARAGLATALGVTSDALADVKVHFDFSTVTPAALTAPAARDNALRGRADILGALADYAVAEADLRLQVAKQYPDLHLGPGYAWNNGNAGDSQWSLGLTLELPILDQNQGPIAEAAARRKLAAAKFLALQAQVIAQIERANAGLAAAQAQLKTGATLRETAEQQTQAIASQVQAGESGRLDSLSAKIDLDSIKLAQLDGEIQFQTAIGALEDALQQPWEGSTAAMASALAEPKGQQP